MPRLEEYGMRKILAVLLLTSLNLVPAFAHEYWFEPETFFPAANQKTVIRLYVGDGLVKDREERAYQPEKTVSFDLFSAYKMWNLKDGAKEGSMPVYTFFADRTGNYLLAMERNWSFVTLGPQEFEDYLRTDGMEYVIGERAKLGEQAKEGRERYARFIKSLLQVGGKRDNTYKKKLGLKLELIPLENPYLKKVDDAISFQILFDGKPLAGRTVFADNRMSETQRMVTDKNGKFSFKLDQSGLWLARLVVMQRCKTDCGESDWESFWGAFSFGVK